MNSQENPYQSPTKSQPARAPGNGPLPEDPAVKSGRREALVVLVIWLVAMSYTVGYCYLNGYGRKIEDLRFVLGFPDWIFWGIITPWLVCLVFSWWFSYRFMSDEDLGQDPEEDAGG